MLDDGIPVGSEVVCTYNTGYDNSFEFKGIYRGLHLNSHYTKVYAIEVVSGTGHKHEGDLHDCNGLVTRGLGWNLFEGDEMRLVEANYDPNQNGDTDEDI